MTIKEMYEKLPKELHVFVEYILPSAVLTAVIDYLTGLEINDVYVAGIINLVLVFLREIKPRREAKK